MAATKADLPKLVQYLYTHDGGPCDDGPTATCPHCGADGRYVHWFKTADGDMRGAMSGCIKLYPVSPVAREDMRLREKEADYAKSGWQLPSWDKKMQQAIEAFYAGTLSEAQAVKDITRQKAAAAQYRRQRGRR